MKTWVFFFISFLLSTNHATGSKECLPWVVYSLYKRNSFGKSQKWINDFFFFSFISGLYFVYYYVCNSTILSISKPLKSDWPHSNICLCLLAGKVFLEIPLLFLPSSTWNHLSLNISDKKNLHCVHLWWGWVMKGLILDDKMAGATGTAERHGQSVLPGCVSRRLLWPGFFNLLPFPSPHGSW